MTEEKMTAPKRKPRFIKPPNTLKTKVGTGGFDEMLIARGQEHIDRPQIDFLPFARQFLDEFSALVKEAAQSDEAFKTMREKLVRPIMQMKANGGMFQYPLITQVADIALQFLEEIKQEKINNEALDILRAHENALKLIVAKNLRGPDRPEGAVLLRELDGACRRYFEKYKE